MLARLLAAASVLLSAFAFAEEPKLIISEDFENVPVGQTPKGYVKKGSLGVVDDVCHSGKKSLRIDPATKGGRTLTKTGPELAALGGQFWGRFYFKVKLPSPLPLVPEGKKTASIHATFVSGKASSPLFNDPIEVRLMGCSTNMAGTYAWMYNVQTAKRGEFGVGAKNRSKYSDEWTLAEWSVDAATQSYHFYINGQEIADIAVSKGAGKFAGAELPAFFDSLTVGWVNYQAAAGEGFTVWIDDLALSKMRIGPTSAK